MSEDYTVINGKKFRKRVDVIATVEGGKKILCCLRGWNNRTELTGGGIDKGETVIQAAMRETMEEAGWVCKDFEQIDVLSKFAVYEGSDSEWLREQGYDGEIQYTVKATAVEFKPNSTYRAEGDGRHFNLNPVEVVIDQIQKDISDYKKGELNSHLYTQAQYRLTCLLNTFPEMNCFINNSTPEVLQKW